MPSRGRAKGPIRELLSTSSVTLEPGLADAFHISSGHANAEARHLRVRDRYARRMGVLQPERSVLLHRILVATGVAALLDGGAACGGIAAGGGDPSITDAAADATQDSDASGDGDAAPPRPLTPAEAEWEHIQACRKLVVSWRNRGAQRTENVTCPDGAHVDAGDLTTVSVIEVCFPAPGPTETCDARYADCVRAGYHCGLQVYADGVCQPQIGSDGACCYVEYGGCPIGRPFVVDGVARTAVARASADWRGELVLRTEDLDPVTRATLAEAWEREALTEHASIGAFARFVLELLAVGAPADQVARAARALADEERHARLAFDLASTFAEAPRGPGPLAIAGALAGDSDLASVAARTAAEGCIAETVAAVLARAAATAARDPSLGAALCRVADEEAEHAELAWVHVAWALRTGGAGVEEAVATVFADVRRHVSLGTMPSVWRGDAETLRAYGVLGPAERRSVAEAAVVDIVLPAARALLASLRTGDAQRRHPPTSV